METGERTFNLDLENNSTGAAGADGQIDASGTWFLNWKSLITTRDNLREAVTIAKEVAPYRHPRLSSVKVGSDRTNASYVPDGVTSGELREELFSMIARSGVLPTAMSERLQRAEALPEHQGVVNRRANGNR